MTRPAVLPLLILLALTACAGNAPRRPQDAILATPGMQVQASATSAELMGENQPAATPEPTALPTIDPVIIQLAADVKAANERAQEALNQINAQNERIAKSNENAAIANAQTAKYNDAQRAKDVDIANAITTQKIAEAANTGALAKLADAQARQKEADAKMIFVLCLVVLALIAYLLMKSAMIRPHVNNIVTRRVTGEKVEPIAVTKTHDDYDTTPPGDLAQFAELMEHGIKGRALGHGSVMDAQIYKAKEYAPVRAWMDRKEQRRTEGKEPSLFKQGANNSRIFSVDGIVWAQAWLDWYYPQSPSPDAQIAENVANSPHDHVENGRIDEKGTEGGRVVDDFDILDGDK